MGIAVIWGGGGGEDRDACAECLLMDTVSAGKRDQERLKCLRRGGNSWETFEIERNGKVKI